LGEMIAARGAFDSPPLSCGPDTAKGEQNKEQVIFVIKSHKKIITKHKI